MRKLDLTKYDVPKRNERGELDGSLPYEVKTSVIELLFTRSQGLGAIQLLERDELATKIHSHSGNEILLEDAEFALVEGAIDAFKGFGKEDVEFVKRIKQAEKVDGRDLKLVKKKES